MPKHVPKHMPKHVPKHVHAHARHVRTDTCACTCTCTHAHDMCMHMYMCQAVHPEELPQLDAPLLAREVLRAVRTFEARELRGDFIN